MRKHIAAIIASALVLSVTHTVIAQHSHREHPPSVGTRLRRGKRAGEDAEVHLPDASRSHNRSSGKLSEMRDETCADKREETPNVQRPTRQRRSASRRSTSNVAAQTIRCTMDRDAMSHDAHGGHEMHAPHMSRNADGNACTPPSISLIR